MKARADVLDGLKPPSGNGDGRGGVVWHTQGSGKSLTMLMLAGALVREPRMANPTIVMITDRNDLDDQLFDTFAAGRKLLRQDPVQAREPRASQIPARPRGWRSGVHDDSEVCRGAWCDLGALERGRHGR